MNVINKWIIVGSIMLIIGFMTGCRSDVKKQISGEVQANEMNKTIVIGDIKYDFMLRTHRTMKQMNNYNLDKNDLDKNETKDDEDVLYLIINHQSVAGENVLKSNLNNIMEYDKRVTYYNFQVMNDIKLICGADTLSPIAYNYENNQSIISYNTMLFVFEKCTNDKEPIQIVFNDMAFQNMLIKETFSVQSF